MRELTRTFFSPAGTIDRQAFTLAWLFWLAVEAVFLSALLSQGENTPGSALAAVLLVAVSAIDTVSVIMLSIKRARTVGWPPLLGLLTLIPVLSLALVLVLSGLRTREEAARGTPFF
jgi:uncharacterized membrane protein YhaH (DUF805 family)